MSYDIPAEDLRPEELEPEERNHHHADHEHTDDHIHAQTMFVVWLDQNGQWVASGDMTLKIKMDRPAMIHDMQAGCSVVHDDVTGIQAANRFLQMQQQMMQEAMRQQEAQAILQKVKGGVDLSQLGKR